MSEAKLTYLKYVLEEHPEWVPDWDKQCLTRDFVDTKRFSPVIYDEYEAKPEVDNPEYDAWWIEQYRRCMMGYVVTNATKRGHDVWISGRMYFYLNFWIISVKKDGRKVKSNPRFTSLDYFKFMCIEMMFLDQKDMMWPKARQKGFSEFIASTVGYNFSFLPYSQTVIVAGQGNYAINTMKMVKIGLNHLVDTEFYKRTNKNREDYFNAGFKETIENDETGEKRTFVGGYGSEVYCITANNNTQALSGLSPFMTICEEMGKWKKGALKETSAFIRPSIIAEGGKTGYMVYIGTGGDIEESVDDVQEMAYNPESFGIRAFDNIWEEETYNGNRKCAAFIPTYEFLLIDEDGNSLIEESKEHKKKEWAEMNRSQLYTAIISEPFYLSQMFMITSGGFFGEETLVRLNDRKRYILTHPEEQICFRARLEWIDNTNWEKGVNMLPDEEGEFYITQLPEKDNLGKVWINLYNAATDSYDKGESNSSESKGSCTIWKNYIDANHTGGHWVARVTERPTEQEGGSYKFYEDTIKLCIYYGDAINLIEYSNILIFEYYKRKNVEYLLKERPAMLISTFVKDAQANQRYGIEPSFVPHGLNMLRDKLKEDNYAVIDKIHDLYILERLASFKREKGYNCDITISMAFNIASAVDDIDVSVMSSEEEEEFDYGAFTEDTNGNINWI